MFNDPLPRHRVQPLNDVWPHRVWIRLRRPGISTFLRAIATQLADITARITRLHMHIAENVQGSADRHRVEERIHTVLDELQAVGDETLEMSSVSEQHQVNQLQQFFG